jgi:hypothetical protein
VAAGQAVKGRRRGGQKHRRRAGGGDATWWPNSRGGRGGGAAQTPEVSGWVGRAAGQEPGRACGGFGAEQAAVGQAAKGRRQGGQKCRRRARGEEATWWPDSGGDRGDGAAQTPEASGQAGHAVERKPGGQGGG